MKNKTTIITIVAAILVVAIAFVVGPLLNDKLGDNKNSHENMSMPNESGNGSLVQKDSEDYKMYAALDGDDYDKAFMSGMITHHEGAVDMAELALTNAKRQEIKDMAQDIIAAQNKEIDDMRTWQKQWGYVGSTDHSGMNHGSSGSTMNMADHMDMMMDELRGKTGDEFDKAFLEQMIMHHQGALNMAAPGQDNAKHQEIKDLTKAVVDAQTKEIKQMQAWQKEWGL
ncbi:MAG TPA: DUF305 domain-containing protein [Candidatus Saccharibacteria bacterium]|nr:DUF305 domain-containing protein [Candidatus Saccharibacteria bacterium]